MLFNPEDNVKLTQPVSGCLPGSSGVVKQVIGSKVIVEITKDVKGVPIVPIELPPTREDLFEINIDMQWCSAGRHYTSIVPCPVHPARSL